MEYQVHRGAAPDRAVRWGLLGMGAQFLTLGLAMGCWAVGLPALKQRFAFSDLEFSLLLLALAAGAAVAFFTGPRAIAAVGERRFTRIGAALAAYALVSTQVVSAPVPLALTAFVLGWATTAFDIAINSQASTLERLAGRSVMSKLHAMFSTGGVLAALAAAPLFLTHRPVWWLAVPVALLLVVLALVALPRIAPAHGDPVDEAPPAPRGTSPMLRRLGLAALLCLLCEGVMYDWSAVYLLQALDTSLAMSIAGFGVFSAAMALGRFLGDGLRDRHGAGTLLALGCGLAAVGALGPVVSGAREVALAGFVLVGLGLSNVIPVVFALAPRAYAGPPERAIAFVSGIGFVGFLVGPPLVGLWSSVFSLQTALLIVVAACTGVAVLAVRNSWKPAHEAGH